MTRITLSGQESNNKEIVMQHDPNLCAEDIQEGMQDICMIYANWQQERSNLA